MKPFSYITKLWTALCFGFLCFSLATPLGFAQTPSIPGNNMDIATTDITVFIQGAPAHADEMNENFETIRERYNDLSAKFNQLLEYVRNLDSDPGDPGNPPTPPSSAVLVAHQKFDSSLTDSVTGETAIAMTATNDVATQIDYSAGVTGQALEMRNIRLELPSADPWNLSFPNYSISLWVKAINNPGVMSILKLNAVTGYFELVTGDSLEVFWQVQTVTNGVSSNMHVPQALTDEQWHHIVLVQDGGTRKMYFDSVLQHTDDILTPQIADSIHRVGGVYPPLSDYFLDEMRLYDGALTQAQINDLYTNP